MTVAQQRLPRYVIGEGFTPPPPANEDVVFSGTRTPAEALQIARRTKKEMCGELIADPRLWNCPDHRETRDLVRGVEQCALRHFSRAK
jgi:hypothetical protein